MSKLVLKTKELDIETIRDLLMRYQFEYASTEYLDTREEYLYEMIKLLMRENNNLKKSIDDMKTYYDSEIDKLREDIKETSNNGEKRKRKRHVMGWHGLKLF